MNRTASGETTYNLGFLWCICLVAAMGGLLFGYDWVVIGGAKPFYEPFFDIGSSEFMQAWAMSSALFGCLIGAVVSGMLSDRFGRKRLLILAGLLFIVSALGTALAEGFSAFNLYRIIGGVGIGLASNLSPMYIAEIAPAGLRGRFVSINQLTIVIGILLAQSINLWIARPVPTIEQLRLLNSTDDAIVVAYGGSETFDLEKARTDAKAITDPAIYEMLSAKFPEMVVPRPLDELLSETDRKAIKKEREVEDKAIMAAYIEQTWNGRVGWRWMFAAETVFAALFFLLMFFVPESPRWLVKNGNPQTAERILTRIGGAEHAVLELGDIQATLAGDSARKTNYAELLEPRLKRVLGLGVFLAVFQQWCGINVIFNYAQEVFQAAGFGVSDVMFSIVITGIANLLFTFVAIYTVDRLGRRALMLFGAGGLCGIYAAVGAGYYFNVGGVLMVALIVAAIACYAMSLAPITWVVISEIFPNRIRGAAMSVAVSMLWIGCITLTFSFPKLNSLLGPAGAFWLYGFICAIGFLVIFRTLPETKGKSLEAIERELVD